MDGDANMLWAIDGYQWLWMVTGCHRWLLNVMDGYWWLCVVVDCDRVLSMVMEGGQSSHAGCDMLKQTVNAVDDSAPPGLSTAPYNNMKWTTDVNSEVNWWLITMITNNNLLLIKINNARFTIIEPQVQWMTIPSRPERGRCVRQERH